MGDPFHRIFKSQDPMLPEWRLRVSADCAHEVDLAEEIVHPEQVENPNARHTRRREVIRVTRDEAVWLRDALNAWLVAHPDDGDPCGLLAGEEKCRG